MTNTEREIEGIIKSYTLEFGDSDLESCGADIKDIVASMTKALSKYVEVEKLKARLDELEDLILIDMGDYYHLNLDKYDERINELQREIEKGIE